MIDVAEMATAITVTIGPFLPVLMQSAGKLTDAFATKAGEAMWHKAQDLWEKITEHLGKDQAVIGAAAVVADDPEDEDAQMQFAKILAKRLENNHDIATELQTMLGGPERVQEIITGNQGQVEYVRQSLKGAGKQYIRTGDGGIIHGAIQEQMG